MWREEQNNCYWKDDQTIIAFENKKKTGAGYYLMHDKTQEYRHLWPHISSDGHPSYSPDRRLVVTDTYSNRKRMAILKVLNEDFNIVIAIKKILYVFGLHAADAGRVGGV